jgi:S-formylglutathione hydrolase FrmB
MKKIVILVILLAIAFWGCSKRDNPVESTYPSGKIVTSFVYSENIDGNATSQSAGRSVYIYQPPNYSVSNVDSFEAYVETTGRGTFGEIDIDTTYIRYYVLDADYPSLYLLHDFKGSSNYYAAMYMLKDIMDEMIATNEIIPMLVITPNCSTSFGGSYYTSTGNVAGSASDTLLYVGDYENFIIEDLFEHMDDNYNIDSTGASRAISGHGMGGYGAMKIAMKYPELFSSVSSMSGPLAFHKFADDGFFDSVYSENGFTANDTASFYGICDTAGNYSEMAFAMASAFSPHVLTNDDSTYFHRMEDREDSTWFGIDLPFNVAGVIDTSSSNTIWTKWQNNNAFEMLSALNGDDLDAFKELDIYLDCGDSDHLLLNLQNSAFDAKLTEKSITHTYSTYSGYSGYDAGHSNYLAERLRVILKFHSDNFVNAASN